MGPKEKEEHDNSGEALEADVEKIYTPEEDTSSDEGKDDDE